MPKFLRIVLVVMDSRFKEVRFRFHADFIVHMNLFDIYCDLLKLDLFLRQRR